LINMKVESLGVRKDILSAISNLKQGNSHVQIHNFVGTDSKKREREKEMDDNQRKFAVSTKVWSRNGLVAAHQNYFYIKREKIMQDFSKKLLRPNEMTFYVYYGPRSSGKSSLMKTLEPPENGIAIMYFRLLLMI
jgi:ATPase subunit of ABC transporter with duplicated ATPase domains